MSTVLSPRVALRELILGLDCLMPYVRQSAHQTSKAAVDLSDAGHVLTAARRLESLPWTSVLEVSTRHLSLSELDSLQAGSSPDPFQLCMANDYAWLLMVPPHASEDLIALGPGLAAIHALALMHGFTYVRLDRDAALLGALLVLDNGHNSPTSWAAAGTDVNLNGLKIP